MNTKLTLTIEQNTIKQAKKYAQNKKRNLSDLIVDYLKSLTNDVSQKDIELTPIVKSLKGSVKAPENFDYDYKKQLTEILTEKYL
jgi:hypothetical protein